MVAPEEVENAAFTGEHLGHRARVDVLEETMLGTSRQHLVWRQFEIKILASQQLIHQRDHLQYKLILAQIVAVLENCHIFVLCNRGHKGESAKEEKKMHEIKKGGIRISERCLLGRHEGALEERCAGGHNLGDVHLRIEGEWNGLKVGEVHLEQIRFAEQFLKLFRLLVAIARLLGHQLDQLNQFVNKALLLAQIIENATQMKVSYAREKRRRG